MRSLPNDLARSGSEATHRRRRQKNLALLLALLALAAIVYAVSLVRMSGG